MLLLCAVCAGFARDVLTAHEAAYTPPPLPAFLQPAPLAPGVRAGPPGSEGTPRLVVAEKWQFPSYVDHGGWWGDWVRQRHFSMLLWLGFAAAVYHYGYDQLAEWWKGTQFFQVSELVGKKEYPPATVPKTRFSDVVGCDEAKNEVAEIVEFLKNPEKFDRLGGRMTRGLLLLGPPGTGKTLLARAMAGEAGVPFFAVTGADFEEKYTGVGAKRIRELFEAAKRHKRAIIFIDEIDAVGGKRTHSEYDDGDPSCINELLNQMDGFASSSGVIVIAATNYKEKLDSALVRPGRFDRHVTVPVPDIKGRRDILQLYAHKMKLDPAVDLNRIARGTVGMTGADLFHLLNSAALRASTLGRPAVTTADLEYAQDHVMLGSARVSGVMSKEMRKHLAYYNAGKALLTLRTPALPPIHRVTIMQRGESLGQTSHTRATDDDRTSQAYREMVGELDLRMAGRAAEELVYGPDEVSSHARSDLAQAHDLARRMVSTLGFGAHHGPRSHSSSDLAEGTSNKAKAELDAEVKTMLEASHQRALTVLRDNQTELHRVAQALQEYETLDANQVQQACSGQPITPSVPPPETTTIAKA